MQTVDNISTAWMRADEQASFESGKTYQIQNAGVNEVILREDAAAPAAGKAGIILSRGLRFSSSGKKAMLSLRIPRLQLTAVSGGNPLAPLNILDFITDFSGSTMTNPQRILQDGYDYFVNGTEISEYITATLDKNDVLVLKFGSPLNLKKISVLCEGYKLVEAKPWEFSGWFYHPDGSYQAKASPKVYQNFLHTFEWVLDSEYGNNVDHMSLSLQGYTNYSGNLKIYGIYFEAEE